MKMRNCILSFILLLFVTTNLSAQCLNVSFSLPDSICANATFSATNTTNPTAGITFDWDFNTGELEQMPTGVNLGNLTVTIPHQIRPVVIDGNRYIFVCNNLGNSLVRLNFGNSFNNTPTTFSYGNFGGVLSQPTGLDIIKEGGVWYAFITNYTNNKLIRVSLGSSIPANVASATDLGLFGLDNPRNVKIAKEGSNVHVFVTNRLGNNITRVDFGTSVTNAPIGSAALNDPAFVILWGLDIAYDCSLNKYVGFVCSSNQSKLFTLDFGSSLSNTPTVAGFVATQPNPTSLQLVKDGPNWHLISSISGNSKIQNFMLGTGLLNVPSSLYAVNAGTISSPNSFGIVKDSSVYYAFTSNTLPETISRITWPELFLNQPPVSNLVGPGVSVVSSGSGYQTYSLTATDASGNTNSFSDSVFVISAPNGSFVTSPACEGLPVTFTDSSSITSGTITNWQWDFGDSSPIDNSQNPVHTFPGLGPYNISFVTTSSAGCNDTVFSVFDVNPNPAADFTFLNNQCQFAPVMFTDNSQSSGGTIINSWMWDFGDTTMVDTLQNPVHNFNLAGTFDVNLVTTTDAGCTDTIEYSININPTPESGFEVSSTCIGETTLFTNTSIIQGGGAITYNWDFGDTGSSNSTDPTHQYANTTGNYDVTLIATSVNGCEDTTLQNIHIANQPVPSFSWSPLVVCQGNVVSFSNASTGSLGDTIAGYIWDFGDLQSSMLEDPTHVYADTGYFDVTLTAISPTFCDSSITQQVYVIPGPEVSFLSGGVCLNNATSFNLSATTPPGTTVDSVVWDFGDSTFFTGLTSPTHTYAAPGTYGVTVTVYNDLLCTGSFIDSVTVYPLPVADFTTSLVCTGAQSTFDGTISTVALGNITSWLWDFGGQGSSTDSIAAFTFQSPGLVNVTLISTSNFGCSDTITQQVTATQSPDFTFIFNEPCFGSATNFTYISNITPVPPSNLTWQFGDSTLSSLLSPSHIYSNSDTFNVTLTVLNPNTGCTSTEVNQVYIKPVPQAGFIIMNDCEGQPFDFNDTTYIENGFISNWNWDFGTLGTSTDENPQITPYISGNFPVTLNVISDEGCTGSSSGNFTVFTRPTAVFTPDPTYGSPPLTINFNNQTTGGSTFTWDFGDNTNGTGLTPTHIYADTGIYQITMYATSAEGCIDTAINTVNVLIPYMDIAVSNVFASVLDGKIKLTAQLTNMGNITINKAILKGIIENGTIISENWTGMLQPGTSVYYDFNASYEISDNYRLTYYCVEALDPNDDIDQNLTNNKKCAVLINEFEIFNVYPNPFNDEININFNLNSAGSYEIIVYNDLGQVVNKNLVANGVKGFNNYTINTLGYANGKYTISVKFRDEIKSTKALKVSKK